MTEVLTYATEEEVDSYLEITFDLNNQLLGTLEARFGDLTNSNKFKTDGEQFEVDCAFRLEKISGRYSVDGGVRNELEVISTEHYNTLEELVTGIKKSISSGEIFGLYEAYGINVNPLFYTVPGEHKLPEYGREEMK
ncbi:MAG: hypothetical protein AABX39_02110, partial [Nanoarchaeota archaeon]